MRPGLVPLLSAIVLAGCGGGDRLSKAEYTEQADAICARYDKELETIEQDLAGAQSPQDAAAAIDRGIPIVRKGVAELRELEPPEELDDEVDRWLELNDENVKNLEELRDAAKGGDTQRAQEVAEKSRETERKSDEVAARIGLDECASE